MAARKLEITLNTYTGENTVNITIPIPPQCESEVLAVLQRYLSPTQTTTGVASPAPTEPAVTIEEVRQVLTKVSQLGKAAQVKELLATFGAKNVKELQQADFAAVLQKASAL
jgi:hypothetical protein